MAIYQRRLDEKELEAEDHLVLGLLHPTTGAGRRGGASWKKVLEAGHVSPQSLEELGRLCVQGRRWEEAILATERLSRQPGWEARGSMMLGTIRVELNNMPGAAVSFRRALELDPAVVDKSHDPTPLRKVIARTFLRTSRPDEAWPLLQSILDRATRRRGRLAAEPRLPSGRGQGTGIGGAETGRVLPRRQPARGRARPLRGRGTL